MFAIVEDGSRQFRVEQGETLHLDYRSGVEAGSQLTLDKVLLANGGKESIVGRPHIDGATVTAEVVEPLLKGEKIEVFKIRRRKNSRTHTGHRQKYTAIRITGIDVPGLEVSEPASPPVEQPSAPHTPVTKQPASARSAPTPAADAPQES